MELYEKIDNVLSKMTEEQSRLFAKNLELWEKTADLNGRPQHFDSFEVDSHMLKQGWYNFLEDINSIEFDPNLTFTDVKIPPLLNEDKFGYIYALKNESLEDDLVKIGMTGGSPFKRAEDLSRPTGVPTTFEVLLFCNVTDRHSAENWLKESLAEYRVSSRKEFYKVPQHILKSKFAEMEGKWGTFEELTLKLPSWIVKQLKQNDHSIFHLETIVEDLFIERFEWKPNDSET